MTTETKAAHTPGPWTLDEHRYVRADVYRDASRGTWPAICVVRPWPSTWTFLHEAESTANANLIAAAPDLMKAVQEALLSMTDGSYIPESIGLARAAIAKATGETP